MSTETHSRATERPGRPLANPERDTRALLLNATTALFAEQGVAATSFSTIARRAGLTPAMMHYHFDDREQLIDAVVDERLVPFIHAVWDPVRPGLEPSELISGLVQRLLEQIGKAPWVPSTWMREILNEGGLLREHIFRRLPFDKIRIVAQTVARGQDAGNANAELNPLLVVFSTLGLVMVHMATLGVWAGTFHRSKPSSKAMQRHITGLLLYGLSPGSGSTTKANRSRKTSRKKP